MRRPRIAAQDEMPFTKRCRFCNNLFFGVNEDHLKEVFGRHIKKKHPEHYFEKPN